MEKTTWADLLKDCDGHVRAGRVAVARRALSKANFAKIPRKLRLPFANLCRRVGLVASGLRALTPLVLSKERGLLATPSPAELAEYAVLLQRAGAVREAHSVLDRVDTALVPEVRLFRALCLFNTWDYAAAIPVLKDYLASPLDPYAHLVGSVNLTAAHLATEQTDDALVLLDRSIERAREGQHLRLLGNCLELRGQAHLLRGDFERARYFLDEASSFFACDPSLGALYLKKWNALLQAQESKSEQPLLNHQREALEFGDWESVRDADFRLLKLRFDESRFERLLFGTPFPAYRERLYRAFNKGPTESTYVYGHQSSPCLDLTDTAGSRNAISGGGKILSMIEILLRDFYRPLRMGGLFAELFPDEHFDVFSSPARVYQVLWRARRWLEEEKIPARLSVRDGNFRLRIEGSYSFRLPLERQSTDRFEVLSRSVRARFTESWGFTSREGAEALGLSVFAFRRYATWAVDRGILEKFGASSSTQYRLCQAA